MVCKLWKRQHHIRNPLSLHFEEPKEGLFVGYYSKHALKFKSRKKIGEEPGKFKPTQEKGLS